MSDSSDSDDDYLTQHNARRKNYDREALVRKKLLENFYGKTTTVDVVDDDSLDDDSDENHAAASTIGRSDDLDSAAFDAKSYAANLIRDSSVQELLETEDRLAREVRTLDSTMQTLVYENYSRFIDATDAIRSIGVNVQANEIGLRRLTEGMESIDSRSKVIEDALGSLRDQVAEKIRIKRLLTRLDALLKLPQTLREQIKLGKYRTATRSYLSASSILRKHSEGFESLKSIETECHSILSNLRQSLKSKILHWSGRITPYDEEDDGNTADLESDALFDDLNIVGPKHDSTAPEPPKTMTDVFECAGTLYILLTESKGASNEYVMNSETELAIDSDLTTDDLQSMAISASMRLLDRMLDSHLIQVQERRYAFDGSGNLDMKLSVSMRSSSESSDAKPPGDFLIPREFLDSVLEGATLYGMSFGEDNPGTGNMYLMEFVSEALSSFFSHIRSILYEESIDANRSVEGSDEDLQDDFNSVRYSEIAGALSLLVLYVRELASGLALPEVGINAEFTEKLVDQTMHLTEVMVRRRVDQKFHDLRVSVVKHCLLPFVNRAVEEREIAIKEGKPVLFQIVQIASNTLYDCLQLVDDAIRSIFSGGLADSISDFSDLKEAVYGSTYRFASWLANAFEIIAGGESTDSKRMIEAPQLTINETQLDGDKQKPSKERRKNSIIQEDHIDFGSQQRAIVDLLDLIKAKLVNDEEGAGSIQADYILAIAELCRLSQESVSENLDQSIASHAGGGKKRSRGFLSAESSNKPKDKGEDREIAERFQLANSRVLIVYATNAGMEAGNILCNDLRSLALKSEDEMPVAPRDEAWHLLRLAKRVSIQCFNLFGGLRRAGPLPEWESTSFPILGALSNRKTGLHLDVERMFKEKSTIYPHPTETIETSRNGILFLFFKIAFRELFESARLCALSIGGFAQLFVDIEFLKHMIPHYINDDFNEKGVNAVSALSSILADTAEVIEDRICDGNYVDTEDLKRDSREIIISFLATAGGQVLDEFVINED